MPRSPFVSRLTSLLRPQASVQAAAPSVPARYLIGLVYPATTSSLTATLERNDAPPTLIARARKLAPQTFASGEEIVAAIRGQ